MKDTFNKFKTYIIAHKVPTIVASVVLVTAIAVGVTFGVINHKDNIETNEPFGDGSSSTGSSSTISVPPIEDNSSAESTSSEDNTSSASETIETNSTPSKEESVSSTQSSSNPTTTTKPASSQPSNTTPSTPVTSTPSNSTGGGNTETGSKWVCPDPAAHGGGVCPSEASHKELVEQWIKDGETAKNQKPIVYPEGQDYKTWCTTCNKPRGDGHNGTCYLHWEGDTIVHGNYD